MKVRIIANPVSGGGKGKVRAERLEQVLLARDIETELIHTEKSGDARAAAQSNGADCVVSVGGDGTANEILNGFDMANAPDLAILRCGTANVVARELGVSSDPEAIADLILSGQRRSMDMGLCGERRFLLGAGAGLDAAITARVATLRGGSSNLIKWVWPVISTAVRYPKPPVRVYVDDQLVSVDAEYAVVGNCRFSAGVFPATPKARIDDGLLDVCLMHQLNAYKLAELALEVWSPVFLKRPDITYLQGKRVRFEPAGEVAAPLQIDGDPAGEIPAEFGIVPGAITVVAPPAGDAAETEA